jgi:hypothetical protein
MKRSALSDLLLIFFFLFLAALPAQQPSASDSPFGQGAPTGNAAWRRDQLKQMQKQQKAERQKQLKADTDRLYQLATDLKSSVDKTNENILSVDVVKKAEEIEKLAKHIKTNMRDEIR